MKYLYHPLLLLLLLCLSCKGANSGNNTPKEETSVNIPCFNADSALASIKRQCDFGPRTLGSVAHESCGQYIAQEFTRFGCTVTFQHATFTRYDGKSFPGYNIIACTQPDKARRIMICAHWDSRPWADQDANPAHHHTPVPAANDGASGVGVMIELARILSQDTLSFGVDFVCFDAEDMGTPGWDDQGQDDGDTWCLGSQYWAHHPHNKHISYAILLDMVGGQGATFYREGFSDQLARHIVDKVWKASREAGFSGFFNDNQGGYITDDHLPINRIAHIPAINIVPYCPDCTNAFGNTWHTTSDDVNHISKETLHAVGQTLLQLIYTE